MEKLAIIMAAGHAVRMHSDTTTVLHPLMGKVVLRHVVDGLHPVCDQQVLVLGDSAKEVLDVVGEGFPYCIQDFASGKGTAKAVMAAASFLDGKTGKVIITAGDMPCVSPDSYQALMDAVDGNSCKAALLYTDMDDPASYGRVIFDKDHYVAEIVEKAELTLVQGNVLFVNASIYCFDIQTLLNTLPKITNQNNKGEYYLTDAIGILAKEGEQVAAVLAKCPEECLGINTRNDLAKATAYLREEINDFHMDNGVTLIDPKATYIESGVEIGQDTVIYPGCFLQQGTKIGSHCMLLPNSRMQGAVVGDYVTIENSVLLQCTIGDYTTVGPFAYVRPNTCVGDHCRIGDFVELKNSTIGSKTKVSHLTYVGDSDLGKDINLGCGVVFVNYDGKNKQRSTVEDGAFIGCNTNLVAPVHVGKEAYIAAGATVTEDIPAGAMHIARARGTTKEGWVDKRRESGKL